MSDWLGLLDFDATSTVQEGGRIVNEYNRTYLYANDANYILSAPEIVANIGIYLGSPVAGDIYALCNSINIKPGPAMTRPPNMYYTVAYKWSTAAQVPVDSVDPLDRRVLWTISPTIQQRYIVKDRTDTLIVNTAGQAIDGGVPADVRLGTVTAKRNESAAGFNVSNVLANSGKVNSNTFLGGAPGTVQVDISAEERYESTYHFWAVTYTFNYDPAGWQPKFANLGFWQRASVGSNTLKRIKGEDVGETDVKLKAQGVQEPEPLDADGILVPIANRPDSCIYVDVDYFATMDFNSFGLL